MESNLYEGESFLVMIFNVLNIFKFFKCLNVLKDLKQVFLFCFLFCDEFKTFFKLEILRDNLVVLSHMVNILRILSKGIKKKSKRKIFLDLF